MSIEAYPYFVQDPNKQPHRGLIESEIVDNCRRLVAKRYLEVKYIQEDQLNIKGHLSADIDPYVDESEYFWKTNEKGEIDATLRIIHMPADSHSLLPIESSFDLFPEAREELLRMRAIDPSRVVEISALAKEKGVDRFATLEMYKTVWQHAKRTGLELCAISADARLHEDLKASFGTAVVQAGEPTEMLGSLTVPSLLYPSQCAEAMAAIYKKKELEEGDVAAIGYRQIIDYLREGLETEYFSTSELDELRAIGCTVD